MNTQETADQYDRLDHLTKSILYISTQYVELCRLRPEQVDRYTEDFRDTLLPMLKEHAATARDLDAEEAGGDQMVGKAKKVAPRHRLGVVMGISAKGGTPSSPYSPFPYA